MVTKSKSEFPQTLIEAIVYFSDADKAVQFLASMRWPEGVICPMCKGKEIGFISTRRIWKCKLCKKQFSVKTGSVMEDSPLGLDKWLPAIWMIVNDRNGVSSCEIARSIGITQKSAWFLLHRIRLAMANGSFEKLKGSVEIDESYFGGEPKNMHVAAKIRRGIKDRDSIMKPVMGIVERGDDGGTEVRAGTVRNTLGATMLPIIHKNVEYHSTIHTDCHGGYRLLSIGYKHKTINHSQEYVNGDIHTNTIENYWSVLKRGLKGTYIRAYGQHLDRYIAEQSFRYNNRKESDADRFQKVLQSIGGKRLTYDQLTGGDDENGNDDRRRYTIKRN